MQPKKVILASSNPGKIREFQAIMPSEFELIPQSIYGFSDAEEIGLTFVENAIIKARHAALQTGLPAIGDDSGLEVDFLNGEPGVRSARYAGDKATNEENLHKLCLALKGVPESERKARYRCVIVYLTHAKDPSPLICQSSWEGYILENRAGENGFGYDPLFYLPTYKCTAAELEPEIKNKISHRAQALEALLNCIE